MDYGFVPGGTEADLVVGDYLRWRGVSFPPVPYFTVESFIDVLETSNLVQRPVNDLAIGCHGHQIGLMQIQLDSASPEMTGWEDATRASTTLSVAIPTPVLEPRPVIFGVPVQARVRLVACDVGSARPFVAQLKDAFGGAVLVTATAHIESMVYVKGYHQLDGVLRFLSYNFRITRPTRFADKPVAVEAFHKLERRYIDNSLVPRSVWERLIPDDVGSRDFGEVRRFRALDIDPPLAGVPPCPRMPLSTEIFEFTTESIGPFTVSPPPFDLLTWQERSAFMAAHLRVQSNMQPSHPFPVFKRWGYETFDAFMDGLEWDTTGDRSKWTGFRYVYTVRQPVTLPANSNTVLFDFVSRSGSPTHLGLAESDPLLFTTV